jgi:predicted transcriptional regulator
MRRFAFLFALLVSGASAPIAMADAPPPAPRPAGVDFTLETSAGGTKALSSLRGKVVVMFYEDRHHTETNARVKEAVGKYGVDNKLQTKVEILAVANLKGYDFNPAESIARRAIQGIAARFNISIWMDWKGVVIDKVGVQDANANVVVFDKDGVVKWKRAGRLGDAEQQSLLDAVKAAL